MSFKDARSHSGLYLAHVARTARVSPHFVRVTVAGEDVARLPHRGFDHWFRLFLPRAEGETSFRGMPESFGIGGYLKYLTTPSGTRPVVRSYTVREHRPADQELDIDFVAHGDLGLAGPWAERAQPGEEVAILDQGCGFDVLPDADFHLLAGDESALPAIVGILRDLPRDSRGLAVVEVPDHADIQKVDAPDAVELRWLTRDGAETKPGALALAAVREFVPQRPESLSAYLAGEQELAAEGRRHLVAGGVPKSRISFTGYWRHGKAASSV